MPSRTQPSPQTPATFGQGRAAARVLRHAINAAAVVGGRLAPETSDRLATIGGTLEWAIRRRKRRVLAENLRHALGPDVSARELLRATREEIVNEGRRSADLLWGIAHPELAAGAIRIERLPELRALLARGRGLILAGPHIGGWEAIVPVITTVPDISVTAIVDDDWLAWAIDEIRRRSGLEIVSISEPPLRALSALRDGQVLIVLADVAHPEMRTCEVELLGAPIELPAGPAALARIAGAPIVPFAALPIDTRAWRIWTGTPIEPPARHSGRAGERAAMQQLADSWSALIRAHPTQWAAVYPMPWLNGHPR